MKIETTLAAILIRESHEWAIRKNTTVFFFEAFDESWKGDPGNPLGAEKHWGFFNIHRTPKQVLKNLPKEVGG